MELKYIGSGEYFINTLEWFIWNRKWDWGAQKNILTPSFWGVRFWPYAPWHPSMLSWHSISIYFLFPSNFLYGIWDNHLEDAWKILCGMIKLTYCLTMGFLEERNLFHHLIPLKVDETIAHLVIIFFYIDDGFNFLPKTMYFWMLWTSFILPSSIRWRYQ